MRHLLRLTAILALLACGTAVAAEPRELTLGTVAMEIPAVMFQRLRPLADYLSREIKQPVHLRPAADLSKAVEELAEGRVDIAYLTPIAYVDAYKSGNVRILAKTVTRGRESFRLMLVVRRNSPIRTVRDLAGKRFAFGDEAAILQRAVTINAGIRLEELGAYRFLGHYDNIARGVANGDFDAGILKDTSAHEWEKKGLRILYSSPELPPYNIAVSHKLDNRVASAIQAALLRLNTANPEHNKIIKALDPGYSGFAPATDADYDIVRTLVQPLQK
jgi:phosphonate transport system substrate-binding protein